MKVPKIVCVTVCTFIAMGPCMGQSFTSSSSVDAPAPASVTPAPTAKAPTSLLEPTWNKDLDRWLDLDTLNYADRYRSTFDSDGARSFNQGQQRILATGKFKFDAQGKYGIGFHLSSGRYFNWAYADFIGGGQHQFIHNVDAKLTPYQYYLVNLTGPFPAGFFNSGGGQVYLRQLFLTAEPIRGIELQGGGFAINHGVNTEATSYDDDGYMSGERITIRRPKQIWLSEVSYTRGYVGDLYDPNFFSRGERLSKSNYWQILAQKDFGKRLSVSSDYTYTVPEKASYFLKTTREAIFADVHETKVLSNVRFEAYQKINAGFLGKGYPFPDGKGWTLTASKSTKRFAVDAGVADIDLSYVDYLGPNAQALILGLSVNGDQYGVGKRYFVRPTIPINSWISITGYFNHIYDTKAQAAATSIDVWNGQALTAGLVFDAKKLFFHPHTL